MMAFAGGVPIWGPYLMYEVRNGMSSPRFDLSFHHNVLCRLSFKKYFYRSVWCCLFVFLLSGLKPLLLQLDSI